jgi:hypothetical protein
MRTGYDEFHKGGRWHFRRFAAYLILQDLLLVPFQAMHEFVAPDTQAPLVSVSVPLSSRCDIQMIRIGRGYGLLRFGINKLSTPIGSRKDCSNSPSA